MNVVLINPRIPQNTGNIARTCAVTGTGLHLVRPFGFSLKDKYLKRAGLDYWKKLDVKIHDSISSFREKYSNGNNNKFTFTASARKCYHEVDYSGEEFLIFGPEPEGFSRGELQKFSETPLRLPMLNWARSLNLANSVAVVVYEAYRQLDFPGFKRRGNFLKEF